MQKTIKIMIFLFLWIITSLTITAETVTTLFVITNAENSLPIEGAEILLNGRSYGFTSSNGKILLNDISEGSYNLLIVKSGYFDYSSSIEVSDITGRLMFSLKPKPTKTPEITPATSTKRIRTGTVMIDINLANAEIYINGEYIGNTDTHGKKMIIYPEGIAVIEIIKNGYDTYKESFKVTADLSTIVKAYIPSLSESEDEFSPLLIVVIFILLSGIIVASVVLLRMSGNIMTGTQKGKFDRYQIKGTIGRGGMSTIYKAMDPGTNMLVALKIMDEKLLADVELVRKFFREGQSIMEMNKKTPDSPIVKVYRFGREFGTEEGRPFISMELIPGETVLERIKRMGKLSIEESASIIRELCCALAVAHSIGVYHRDITPDNIIIVDDSNSRWKTRLIDFGVAKHEYTSYGTLDGSITGKPAYMSPEQCKGIKVDNKTDIYSMGILFYTILTGNPPFTSNNPLEVMKNHEYSQVPPLPQFVPEKLRKLISKMLAKKKSERPSEVQQILKDLEVF